MKLMGRESGFIAAYAALANNDVNFCLIPEVPFTLEGFLRRSRRGWRTGGMRSSWWARGPGRT